MCKSRISFVTYLSVAYHDYVKTISLHFQSLIVFKLFYGQGKYCFLHSVYYTKHQKYLILSMNNSTDNMHIHTFVEINITIQAQTLYVNIVSYICKLMYHIFIYMYMYMMDVNDMPITKYGCLT